MPPEEAGPEPGPRETHAVVEEGDEGGEEGGGAHGGLEGAAEALGVLPPREEVEGQVRRHGPLEGPDEAGERVVFAGRPAAHVHDLAREGDGRGGVAPFEGPVVVGAHGLQERRLPRLLAVAQRAFVAAPERLD